VVFKTLVEEYPKIVQIYYTKGVKCVSSKLNPLDFKSLKADSIYHHSLYKVLTLCGLLNEIIICNSGFPSLSNTFEPEI
jgi:hypothetical protein